MVKSLRTRNRFSATSVDQLPHQLVAHLLYGHQLLLPIPDIDRTSYFLVFGANPMASNGSLMTVPDFPNRLRELKAARRQDGRVRPAPHRDRQGRRPSTTSSGPGTDAVRAAGDAARAVRGGAHPPAGVRRRAGRGRRRGRRSSRPSWPSGSSGVPADEIRRITREYAAADGAAAYGRIGVSTHGFGTVCQWAVQLLNLLTGNLDRVGGTMFTPPAIDAVGRRPHRQGPPRRLAQPGPRPPGERRRAAGVGRFARRSRPPATARSGRCSTLAGNPVLSTPDGAALDRALAGLDFMASVDIYVNETTRHADVILPPTTRAGARPLRPGVPRTSRSATRRGSRRRCSTSRATSATTGRSTESSPGGSPRG